MTPSKSTDAVKIIGIFLLFLIGPWGIVAVLVGYAFSNIPLGIVAYVATFWLYQLSKRISDIHRWTKRINGSVHVEETGKKPSWSLSVGPFIITKKED